VKGQRKQLFDPTNESFETQAKICRDHAKLKFIINLASSSGELV
jgi:hypothetical protein